MFFKGRHTKMFAPSSYEIALFSLRLYLEGVWWPPWPKESCGSYIRWGPRLGLQRVRALSASLASSLPLPFLEHLFLDSGHHAVRELNPAPHQQSARNWLKLYMDSCSQPPKLPAEAPDTEEQRQAPRCALDWIPDPQNPGETRLVF